MEVDTENVIDWYFVRSPDGDRGKDVLVSFYVHNRSTWYTLPVVRGRRVTCEKLTAKFNTLEAHDGWLANAMEHYPYEREVEGPEEAEAEAD